MTVTEGSNRLGREKSPYLLQHQHNPVDWFPWGEEAFAKARKEQKPIFLSIGYSTCHWCHVMERESFENTRIAEALNRDFVPIKLDREERPDVDRIYMNFVQATSGHGGWPLNVFLTPGLKPFFGGTYWPPESKHGRAGFPQVLAQVAEVWQSRRDDVLRSADSIHEQIQAAAIKAAAGPAGVLDGSPLERAAMLFKSAYDAQHGGFGGAPKFPQPGMPQFLLRWAARTGDSEAAQMVMHTCDRMADGGICDQLGGGFARYSVDEKWLVPHFEKMLYDNAQLVHLYLDAFTFSGQERHAGVVRGILEYILRDMTHSEGGFYSAEDADSEGHEGKFYCWTLDEVKAVLSPEEAALAIEYFGITREGNFVDHSHPAPLQNQNVLSVVNACIGGEENQKLLRSAFAKLLEARSRRVRPGLDDKVLASWNGLMLGAMARAGAVLKDSRYISAAEKNVAFVRTHLWSGGRLFHRWRDGETDQVEILEGSAFMLDGLLHLYEATLNPAHLEFAIALAESMLARFMDREHGAFWQSPGDNHLIMRLKPDYDGAEPSGNSVAVLALLRLAKITAREDFLKAAEKTLNFFAGRINQVPQAMPAMLQVLDFYLHEPCRIVITGDPASARATSLRQAAQSVFLPARVMLGTAGPVEEFARTLEKSLEPQFFLCTGTECKEPVSDAQKAIETLNGSAG